MLNTPKSECLTLAIVGRVNAGKSTLLNLIAGQHVAIASPVPGTTTDVVEKTMELRPFGRVVFLDTAGFDDDTALWQERRRATQKAVERADIVIAVTTATTNEPDAALLEFLAQSKKAFFIVATQADRFPASEKFCAAWQRSGVATIAVNACDPNARDAFLEQFKSAIAALRPALSRVEHILDGIVPPNGWVMHVVPIDSQAPKGRLILPQVMTLRNALDADYRNVVVTEMGFADALAGLKSAPDLVVCDSQVVEKVMAVLPEDIACTTYSILMARMKGGLADMVAGAAAIATLRDGDRVLVAEVCSHHAGEEDIGRVKIPKLLKRVTGKALEFDMVAGRDFADDAQRYALIVHCGGCMATAEQIRRRVSHALERGVAITNYGVCIAYAQGVLERALKPFGDMTAWQRSGSATPDF